MADCKLADRSMCPNWLERELERGAAEYRAVWFARVHPELVNAMADELSYQPPEPKT